MDLLLCLRKQHFLINVPENMTRSLAEEYYGVILN